METALSLADLSFDYIFSGMMEKLKEAGEAEKNPVKNLLRCVEICKETLQVLKQKVIAEPFNSEEDEISFFKQVKPKFLSHYIYYSELHNIALRRPKENKPVLEEFYNMEYYRLKFTFETNVELYNYYLNDETYLDQQFYLRNKRVLNKSLHYIYIEEDSAFSTGYDYMLAKFIAYEMLSKYISDTITQLHHPKEEIEYKIPAKALEWTDTRVGLAELIYSFHALGCFNNGKADIKELAEFISSAFGKKVDNIYKVFEEIRIRKRNRTQFLDNMKEALNRRMEKDDENSF